MMAGMKETDQAFLFFFKSSVLPQEFLIRMQTSATI
jgi:hypothetical protein